MTATHPVGSLRRFVRARTAAAGQKFCGLCSAPIGRAHRHLFETGPRQLICTCDGCALLFAAGEGSKYAVVPRQVRRLNDFAIPDGEWDALGIPIGLAFFSRHSATGRILANYPSPAGSIQASFGPEHPVLQSLEQDVEALLVNRIGEAREYYIAPIDRCYELTGIVRKHWRGLSGGPAVTEAINQFFAGLNG